MSRFVWVVSQLDALERCLTPEDVVDALDTLPRTLDETYARILRKIEPEYMPGTIRLLQLLAYSERPLSIDEAVDALAIELAPSPHLINRMPFPLEIAEHSSGLISTAQREDSDEDGKTKIWLVHTSLREYLRSDRLEPTIAKYFAIDNPDRLALEHAMAMLVTDQLPGPSVVDHDKYSDVSDFSYVSSIFTEATDSTGLSLASINNNDPLQMASQTLAFHLLRDPVVHDLYSSAKQEFASLQFLSNHDQLLKILLKDILKITTEPMMQRVVRQLARQQSRRLVTGYILRRFEYTANDSQQDRESMQKLLNQQEDRSYSLNRFLQAHQQLNMVTNTDEVDDSDSEDETEDEGDLQGPETGSFIEVGQILNYITAGTPYETFKSNLTCLTRPPTTLSEALSLRNLRALRRLLRKQFGTVAQDEYAWLHDLEDLGYTRDEMAEILLEEASDSPWIYFTPPPEADPIIATQANFHIGGCVHQLAWGSISSNQVVSQPTSAPECSESTSLLRVQRLCGLAGITPSSRNHEEWNGSVTFEENNTAALITYGHSDIWKVVSRLKVTLELFCTAIKHSQGQKLCCDSFTIIKIPLAPLNGENSEKTAVELSRIHFCLAFQLLSEVRELFANQDLAIHKLPTATRLLDDIFHRRQLTGLSVEEDLPNAVHECSLSIQVMSVGFLSYLQAHVGPLHPVFLDTPIRKARLFGSGMIQKEHPCNGIEVDLVDLTCVGVMLQGPVLAFRLAEASLPARPVDHPSPLKFDLITNTEDLVDRWGPAQFIVQDVKGSLPSAIKIGGGVISASDTSSTQFHWQEGFSFTSPCEGIDPTRKIRIGSPISVNKAYTLKEDQCRLYSEAYGQLRKLGTYPPGWERTETQAGFQVGQYFTVQANAAYHKYPGRTLKQYRLQQGDQDLVSFLDDCWAVQVSLCTHIARRVPLRQMVAELLPVFARSTLNCSNECSIWESLKADGGIFVAFHGTRLQRWLRDQPSSHHNLILRVVRSILTVLSESGLDRKGKSLLVSWPYDNDVYQCLEISLSQQESSWAQIIADSEDSATFAYASPCCLETEEYRCRRDDSCFWRNTVPLLETAVTVCVGHEPLVSPPTMSKLVHRGTYYFKTFGSVHVVKVEQPDPAVVAKLVRKENKLTSKMKHRLYARTQLRERSRMQVAGGNVAWLTSSI